MPIRERLPLQNRVDPFGKLHAVEARGAWMGNRGIIHNAHKAVVKDWDSEAWITCRLEYKGRKREVFSAGKTTELFFLDEATAYAAGHRPCGQCRVADYRKFKATYLAANAERIDGARFSDVDAMIHRERLDRDGTKLTFTAELASLPDGTFVELNRDPHLIWQGRLHVWSFREYVSLQSEISPATTVSVLTPFSIVATFRAGLRPQVDESAIR